MAETWPAGLPQAFLTGTWREGFADNLQRSQPDVGPAIVSRRTTANVRPLSGEMAMTGAQVSALATFFDTTTLGGATPVTFPDPRGGSDLLVRFTGPPELSEYGSRYRVTLSFEVLP